MPTAMKPKWWATSTVTAQATAGMTVGRLSPKTAGVRPVTVSRIMDPPVAVNTPIMMHGRTGRP